MLFWTTVKTTTQVSNACRGAYYYLFRNVKIRGSLTTAACKSLVHSLVTSRLDYGNTILYGTTDRLMHRLEIVQRSAARVVLRVKRRNRQNLTAALQHLHWLPMKWPIEYNSSCILCPSLTGCRPISPLCSRHKCRAAPSSTIRDPVLLTVLRHNLERYGTVRYGCRSFSRAWPTLWNVLLEDPRLNECINAKPAAH